MKKAHKALFPRGVFAFTVKEEKGEEVSYEKLDKPRYFRYWDKSDLLQEVKSAGFRSVSLTQDGIFLQVLAVK